MIHLPASLLTDCDALTAREWIVSNGLGAYASGTVSGIATRRYHGLLVAALTPPRGRRVLISHLDETITLRYLRAPLSAHAFPGVVQPEGWRHLVTFALDPLPRWQWRVGEAVLERTIFMVRGQNTTIVRYTLVDAPGAVALTVRPFGAFRDFHHHAQQNRDARIAAVEVNDRPGTVLIQPYESGPAVLMQAPGVYRSSPDWWRGFQHQAERDRGLDAEEDLFTPGEYLIALAPGESAHVVLTAEHRLPDEVAVLEAREIARLRSLAPQPLSDPRVEQLYRAVDLYRADLARPPAVLAGYPWFEDWGRDTLIAFTGLYLVPKRFAEAKELLATFAKYVDQGMLPNRFPDSGGGAADDNTVDAPMWFLHAARRFVQYTSDFDFARRTLVPAMRAIVEAFRRGTRYNIHQRPDGLIWAGDPSTQLTWMDARCGDTVFTPRHGCAVEINALWYAGLRSLAWLCAETGEEGAADRWYREADHVRTSFRERFWNPELSYLYDVVRDDDRDPSVRPNALYAVALPGDLLPLDQCEAVLRRARDELLVPMAVRTLSPKDPAYQGRYAGGPWSRDSAYHQGTAWPFLLGAYTAAVVRVGRRRVTPEAEAEARAEAGRCFDGLATSLTTYGLGHLPEIVEGDAPHRPVGCFAQAWSDAEALRGLVEDVSGAGPEDDV
jgi:predicted glycogen debranching enzyme